MKIINITALLLLLTSLGRATTPAPSPSPWLAATGQLRGEVLEVWVAHDEHRTPQWNPENDDWPISVKKAFELARGALQTLLGADAKHFSAFDIRLKRLFASPSEEKAPWCFVIVFESEVESLREQEVPRGTPPTIPIVVFPDGAVKLPEKKRGRA